MISGSSSDNYQVAPIPPVRIRRKSAWFYSDSKLHTEQCLLKLQKDLFDQAEIDFCSWDFISGYRTYYDSIFFFYYSAGGREIVEAIEAKMNQLRSSTLSIICSN